MPKNHIMAKVSVQSPSDNQVVINAFIHEDIHHFTGILLSGLTSSLRPASSHSS